MVRGRLINAPSVRLAPGQTLSAREVEVDGGITTNGAGIAPIEMHGTIGTLRVGGGLKAAGGGFDTT